jgi:diacylglycerol O-acyltransferase / wax synthase
MIAMERLSREDQIMLWPDDWWPQEIGALAILDGGALLDTRGRFRIEAVWQVIAARLHLIPRFRQVLFVPRRGLGDPLWIDAPAFDVADHVRVVALPANADEAELLQAVEDLRRRPLDRSRPLWEICFLIGLPDKQIGMFVKMHHVIADGIAAVASAGVFLDRVPEVPLTSAPPWLPQPPPTGRELFADNLRRHAIALGNALSALAHPVSTVRQIRVAWLAMREFFVAKSEPASSLNRVVGPDRNLALFGCRLDLVKHAAHAHGATVNDVLLTVIAGGVRALLSNRGEPVDGRTLPIHVPVTLRPAQGRGQAQGNLVGQMFVFLPVGVADPEERLEQIAAQTAMRKARSYPSVGKVLRGKPARLAFPKFVNRSPVNVTSTNVPGPPTPLYLAGARLLEVFPVPALMGNVSLGIGALSYAEQLNITAIADKDACPDLAVFAAGAERDLHLLGTSAALV